MVESEQVLVSNISREQIQAAAHIIIKGKRTKRQRPHSPLSLAAASCSSSAGGPDEGDAAPTTPTTTDEFTTCLDSTEEDQDMAHCLILLAQGHHFMPKTPLPPPSPAHCVYQCRTCDRCFPSFQALGGHRASHKKPRIAAADDKKKLAPPPPSRDEEEEEGFRFRLQFHGNSTPAALSLRIGNNSSSSNNNNNRTGSSSSSVLAAAGKPRVHECAICGAEFTSGQALGGHMRRHRSFTGGPPSAASRSPGGGGCRAESSSTEDPRKSRSVLPLDLNLPAPEDHDHHHRQQEPKLISFEPKETSLLFSSSSLVDCHY